MSYSDVLYLTKIGIIRKNIPLGRILKVYCCIQDISHLEAEFKQTDTLF